MKTRTATLLCVLAAASTAHAAPPSFRGLGFLPGTQSSFAWDVSADGRAVVGYGYLPDELTYRAFRWTAATGMVNLGDLPGGGTSTEATCISGDGTTVAGSGQSAFGNEAFRWKEGNIVGVSAGGVWPRVRGISFDGSRMAGWVVGPNECPEACYWHNDDFVSIGVLPGNGNCASLAIDISADGSVIVGEASTTDDAPLSRVAFKWTEADGMIPLGTLNPASPDSSAYGVSRDGKVVVGHSTVGAIGTNDRHAFRWTKETGMVDLGVLPGGNNFSIGNATNGDGSVVIGLGWSFTGLGPFIWTPSRGMKELAAELQWRYRLDLTGWTLNDALGISADGRTIVGYGFNPQGKSEAWIATLPCPADFNLDGFSDAMDYDDFVRAWVDNAFAADFNGDGFVDAIDLDLFLAEFFKLCD